MPEVRQLGSGVQDGKLAAWLQTDGREADRQATSYSSGLGAHVPARPGLRPETSLFGNPASARACGSWELVDPRVRPQEGGRVGAPGLTQVPPVHGGSCRLCPWGKRAVECQLRRAWLRRVAVPPAPPEPSPQAGRNKGREEGLAIGLSPGACLPRPDPRPGGGCAVPPCPPSRETGHIQCPPGGPGCLTLPRTQKDREPLVQWQLRGTLRGTSEAP